MLNVLSAINYVANDQDQGNDGEGDQGGVAKVLRVNVVVCVTKFQSSCWEKDVVAMVTVSEKIKLIKNCQFHDLWVKIKISSLEHEVQKFKT